MDLIYIYFLVGIYGLCIAIVTVYWFGLSVKAGVITIYDVFVWFMLIVAAPITVLAMIPSDFVLWRKKYE